MARRRIGLLASAAALVAGSVACEPLPPRLQLTVDSLATVGSDDDPGDGVCSSAAVGGGCTLRAAVEEANLAPHGADIALVPGLHDASPVVTGDIRLNPAGDPNISFRGTITVAGGGRLEVHRVNTTGVGNSYYSQLSVDGTAIVSRSYFGHADVDASGALALVDSIVGQVFGPALDNAGTLLAHRSSFYDFHEGGSALASSGDARLSASVIANPATLDHFGNLLYAGGSGTCSGTGTPVSLGDVHVEVPCGMGPGEGDSTGPALTRFHQWVDGGTLLVFGFSLDPASPLIDAIPLGDPSCDTAAVDFYGTQRGIDGDGDGVGGCDIGAIEHRP